MRWKSPRSNSLASSHLCLTLSETNPDFLSTPAAAFIVFAFLIGIFSPHLRLPQTPSTRLPLGGFNFSFTAGEQRRCQTQPPMRLLRVRKNTARVIFRSFG